VWQENRIISGGLCGAVLSGVLAVAGPARAEDLSFAYSVYGGPGLIDMPTAHSFSDGELAFNATTFQNTRRYALSFQFSPRLSATFRYQLLYDINASGNPDAPAFFDYVFDRSFALNYRLLDEGAWQPAVAIGLNDFLGTGFFESEYIVAGKTFGGNVRATVGLGWGRLAGVNSFDNPLSIFGDRWSERGSRTTSPTGGEIDSIEWFQGDAAFFGGIQWQATDRLLLTAEYSSDTYPYEDGNSFVQRTPFNFGLSYKITPDISVAANYLYGSELAIQATYAVNPGRPAGGSGRDFAPPPVVRRENIPASWGLESGAATDDTLTARVSAALRDQGINLLGLSVSGTRATVQIENRTYRINAQALGRTVRVLTGTLPAGVDRFSIILSVNSMPVTQVDIARGDAENLEFDLDGAWLSYTRATIADAGAGIAPLPGAYPRTNWRIDPYLDYSLFDPDAPLRLGIGLAASGSYEVRPGFLLQAGLRLPIAGNLDDATRTSDSVLPPVRSNANIYDKASPQLAELTAGWYFKPGQDLFGRVTVGYLESMFGGISAELLWAPNPRPWALGIEINQVAQRDFDQLFGFQDYQVTTGHVSAYWTIGNDYSAQLDMGRYLAGDWGATLTIDRGFFNGWHVGAFATITDVPFEDFGEGSFDKGIYVTVPLDWASGRPSQDVATVTIRPVLRDGGARLYVSDRLYTVVNDSQGRMLADTWGRFWR
jgi:hypothetical protein